VDRRQALPIAIALAMLVGAVAIYLARTSGRSPTATQTVVITGSASPGSVPTSQTRTAIEPHVDESSGVLTIGVGDSIDSNGVLFGVTQVQAPYGSAGGPPGRELMLVSVELHNSLTSGGDPLTIASRQNFELQDENGRMYDQTRAAGAPKPPDGKLAPGETLDGALAYQVLPGQSYRLLFKHTLVSQGVIVVDLGKR